MCIMKKGLFLLCALALFFVSCEQETSGGGGDEPQPTGVTYKFNAAKGIITFYGQGAMANGKESKLPEWSQYKDAVRRLVIEEGVTTVGDYAFQDFSMLDNVQLPKSLKRIGENAFKNCPLLTSITLPENLKVLEDRAFSTNPQLQTPVFPASLDSIGWACFYGCNAFEEVDLSNTQIDQVSGKCFDACEKLTTVILPPTVTYIGRMAFAYCGKLKNVKVSDHSDPFGLRYLNLTVIGDEAFYLCQSLEDVQFPATLQRLGKRAFANCYNLYSAKFTASNDLTEVGDSTFFQCSKLRVLVYNRRFQKIAPYMFHKCEKLTMLDSITAVRHIGNRAFQGCTELKEVNWPTGLETVGDYAFGSCTSLYDVKLGAYVSHLGRGAFMNCQNASSLTITSYYLDTIPKEAFYQMYGITSVDLPSCLQYVDDEAFAYCHKLSAVTCKAKTPPTITSKSSGGKTFYYVSGSTLTVPKNSLSAYKSSNWAGYFTTVEGKDGL